MKVSSNRHFLSKEVYMTWNFALNQPITSCYRKPHNHNLEAGAAGLAVIETYNAISELIRGLRVRNDRRQLLEAVMQFGQTVVS